MKRSSDKYEKGKSSGDDSQSHRLNCSGKSRSKNLDKKAPVEENQLQRSSISNTSASNANALRRGSNVATAPEAARHEAPKQKSSDETENDFVVGYHSLGKLDDKTNLPAYVKEHDTTLTFPEKLMLMLTHVERECAKKAVKEIESSVGWVFGGKAFVVRNKEKFCKTWLPLFFAEAKFSSFTRKLYRWGFRKMNLNTPSDLTSRPTEHCFGNENFQRDDRSLLSRMRSVTAAKIRSELAAEDTKFSANRQLNSSAGHVIQPSLQPNVSAQIQLMLGLQQLLMQQQVEQGASSTQPSALQISPQTQTQQQIEGFNLEQLQAQLLLQQFQQQSAAPIQQNMHYPQNNSTSIINQQQQNVHPNGDMVGTVEEGDEKTNQLAAELSRLLAIMQSSAANGTSAQSQLFSNTQFTNQTQQDAMEFVNTNTAQGSSDGSQNQNESLVHSLQTVSLTNQNGLSEQQLLMLRIVATALGSNQGEQRSQFGNQSTVVEPQNHLGQNLQVSQSQVPQQQQESNVAARQPSHPAEDNQSQPNEQPLLATILQLLLKQSNDQPQQPE